MKWLFPTLLTLFVVAFRFAGIEYPTLLNVTPLFALFMCFGKDLAGYIYIPIIGFLFSDIILNYHYGYQTDQIHIIFNYCALYAAHMIGEIKGLELFSKTLITTTGFFILTSLGAWYSNPSYGSSLSDVISAIVIGEPNYPPAYLFYLKSLVGNLGFTFLFDTVTKYQLSQEHDNCLHLSS